MTQALSSWLVGHFSLVLRGRYEIVWLTVPLVILAFLFARQVDPRHLCHTEASK